MWVNAFLEQARSDWKIYAKLKAEKESSCHILHYLQMATEKLGKAYLLAKGATIDDVQASHQAFTSFLRVISRNGKLQRKLGMTAVQMRAHVYQILPVAHAIEKLAPALAEGGVNAEYPWKTPAGAIVAPARYDYSLHDALDEPSGVNLQKLIFIILENFDIVYTRRKKGV